ncbi:MAG: cytochrome c [Bacteroidota bacterium]
MKKVIIIIAFIISGSALLLSSCAPTQKITDKSGAQLWGENCNRCHSAPSQDQYSKDQWTIIGTHMKLKAGITNDEEKKIVAFLRGE